jgi:hypothetical protein
MKVKIKEGKKYILVDVNHKDCPRRKCFHYGHYTHTSPVGFNGTSSRTSDHISCLYRDNHGCPR